MTENKARAELNDELLSEESEDTMQGKFLTFHIAGEDYGLEIRYVTEIIGIQQVTEVPDMADFIKGVINLRGKVIPVMDVRLRFGLPPRDYDDRTCIIVINVEDKAVGLVVDKVNEVAAISDRQIEPPPRSSSETAKYIQGIGKINNEVKILLDVRLLLYDGDMATMMNM